MGWEETGFGHSPDDNSMTEAQRRMILSLQEQLDGARAGDYERYSLPKWSRRDASAQIEKLTAKLNIKRKKNRK